MKALLAPYDKAGLVDFAKVLLEIGFDLVATGSTHKTITDAGLPIQHVADLTDFPEILDGRVKTLHPKIHGGILFRRDEPGHQEELDVHGIQPIDLVVGGLYPFVDTINTSGVTLEEALEQIDIGGPTMIRASAKNFPHVIVVIDPGDYGWVGDRLKESTKDAGQILLTHDERRRLALKAFQHVAQYDTAISHYLSDGDLLSAHEVTLGFEKLRDLRYGENPHQKSGVYANQLAVGGIVQAEQLHGIDMSFTNFLDADAAWRVVSDFEEPAVCVVKHTNPCGLAVHPDQSTAYRRAFQGDSMSAYGGIVGFNRPVTVETAEAMKGVLYHIILAPEFEPGVLEMFKPRKQARVLRVSPAKGYGTDLDVRLVSGGALLQASDSLVEVPTSWEVVTERKPSKRELADLAFSWKACKHIKSNAIVFAKDNTLVGMGTGQPNRVTSVHLALRIAGAKAHGSAMASDAFIPFADNVELAAEGGVTSVVQPGGSLRDEDVIEVANRLGMAMVFTGGVRHFRH